MREDWWVDGENDTKYFHARAVVRRKCVLVHQLKNEVGVWTDN